MINSLGFDNLFEYKVWSRPSLERKIGLSSKDTTTYTRSPLIAIFWTGKNLHNVEFALSETVPFQKNSLFQCDISSTLVEFVLNEQFINSP